MNIRDIIQSRLIFVSGKGGVGKTCVSAALGKTAAQAGKKTLSKITNETIELAKSEGLDAHALSIEIRSSKS